MNDAEDAGYATGAEVRKMTESGDIAADALRDAKYLEGQGDAGSANAAASAGSEQEPVALPISGTMPLASASRWEPKHDVPSRRLSLLVEGRDYLKYRETFERLLFAERMPPAQKDAMILKLAMSCLVKRMDAMTAETGNPFLDADALAN